MAHTFAAPSRNARGFPANAYFFAAINTILKHFVQIGGTRGAELSPPFQPETLDADPDLRLLPPHDHR